MLLVCGVQVVPPSVDLRHPLPAGARPRSRRRRGQATAFSAAVVPLVLGVHVAPPSAEPMTVPAAPTARHAVAEVARDAVQRARRRVPVPAFHVEPSVVKRTSAAPPVTAPTAAHAVVGGARDAVQVLRSCRSSAAARSGRRSSSSGSCRRCRPRSTCSSLGQEMPFICCVVPPPACCVQAVPPVVVSERDALLAGRVADELPVAGDVGEHAVPPLPVVAVHVVPLKTSTVPFWPTAMQNDVLRQ